jgi:hypothetical protein
MFQRARPSRIRFGHQRNHGTHVGMDNRCAQHLVRARHRPVAVDLGQTRGTVHRLGGKIPRAIKSQQRVAIKERHRFQRLAALLLPKDTREHRPEHHGGDRVKDFAHVHVARDPRNAVDGVQIALGPCLVDSPYITDNTHAFNNQKRLESYLPCGLHCDSLTFGIY